MHVDVRQVVPLLVLGDGALDIVQVMQEAADRGCGVPGGQSEVSSVLLHGPGPSVVSYGADVHERNALPRARLGHQCCLHLDGKRAGFLPDLLAYVGGADEAAHGDDVNHCDMRSTPGAFGRLDRRLVDCLLGCGHQPRQSGKAQRRLPALRQLAFRVGEAIGMEDGPPADDYVPDL